MRNAKGMSGRVWCSGKGYSFLAIADFNITIKTRKDRRDAVRCS